MVTGVLTVRSLVALNVSAAAWSVPRLTKLHESIFVGIESLLTSSVEMTMLTIGSSTAAADTLPMIRADKSRLENGYITT